MTENHTVEIEDLGNSGEGVGKIDDFTIFVPGGIPGDIVKVKITILKKRYGIGEIIEIIDISKNRVDPKCNLFGICGGCQTMHIDYNEQLEIKRNKVEETLSRIGKIDTKVNPTIGMEDPYGYRNKAQFPVWKKNNKAIMGCYKMGSHEIVDTDYCHIQAPINEKIFKVIKQYIDDFNIKIYDERKRSGLIRHVMTKVGFATGEVMVVLITNGRQIPYKNKLVEMLKENIEGLKSVVQNINTRDTNVVLGDETIVLYGEDKIVDYIGDLKFNISSKSFYQVNPVQTKILYEKTLEYANLTGDEVVFDIYCGIGTISLFLADKAKEVHGVEIVEAAIEDAKKNTDINNINNVKFYVGRAEEIVPRLYKEGLRADVVVVDPPRKGCEESVLQTIVDMEPERVVYVSCNPSTLARDLLYLSENGYKTIEVQPVDMFPQTNHVEALVLLTK
ncbi:MAG: 23S rRNA (uracil(1939)-C(5))-methyltransferase RlmD [Senegalia sp. (in: firmicutes)]